MADLPILNAVDPIIVPEKIYDKVWVEEIIIKCPDPNKDIIGEVKLHKYGMFNGLAELEPGNGQWIRVENMLEKAAFDQDLQSAISTLLLYVSKIGIENNVIAPPA